MISAKLSSILIILIFIVSCSKEEPNTQNIKKKSQELEMTLAYEEGLEKLRKYDTYNAAQKFLEAELLFPQSIWAPKSALMASYSYYMQNYYSEALTNLNRYLKTYPQDKNIAYAHYLVGICYYEMIEDEKRDTQPIINAKEKFELITRDYPNTDFALDAKFKLDLLKDLLASKEMYLARHYQKKNKWIAALNRYKNVVEKYDTTIFVEEALHRLVEINYQIGLIDESKKYAKVLGYNYKSSEWYKKSYKVFNKDYKEITSKKIDKNKKGVL
ncbi:outer membrane protein assembly factor BamD, partial [Candidatus Pelagibacter sp.]|uniref:outer membrane protein assembly factor BamD n=1 Tax=Candidatus Pelagibacter sp. TaxID=2024849 RepID=UPI003F84CB6B